MRLITMLQLSFLLVVSPFFYNHSVTAQDIGSEDWPEEENNAPSSTDDSFDLPTDDQNVTSKLAQSEKSAKSSKAAKSTTKTSTGASVQSTAASSPATTTPSVKSSSESSSSISSFAPSSSAKESSESSSSISSFAPSSSSTDKTSSESSSSISSFAPSSAKTASGSSGSTSSYSSTSSSPSTSSYSSTSSSPSTSSYSSTNSSSSTSSYSSPSSSSSYQSSSTGSSESSSSFSIPTQQVSSVVKRAGPPIILVARPVYAPYSDEGKTMYIAAVSEAYFQFKLGALPDFQVLSPEKIANTIQYYRDFSRRISRSSYIDAAKSLGASYLFYQEYEPQGKKVRFVLEVYSLEDNKKILNSNKIFSLQEMEKGLSECVTEVAAALTGGSLPSSTKEFLGKPILENKSAETFGNYIVSSGDFSQKNAETSVKNYEKIAKQDNMYIAKFVAASAFARAKQYDKAIEQQEALISEFGSSYPALYLQLSEYYKLAQEYDNALDAADKANADKSLALLVNARKASIYAAKGDLSRAKSEYQSVLQTGGEDGEIYLQLALVSIGLGDLSKANDYISQAASAGRALDRGDYYNLGVRYAGLGSANDQAIEAFKNSLGLQQDNQDAWSKLGELYSKIGRDSAAAECYISLFMLNNAAYKDYLPKAGIMFEKLNLTQNAKSTYELFLARRYYDPEVSVRLAKIDAQEGNCDQATELVNGMDTLTSVGDEVKKIMQQCGMTERRVVVPTNMSEQKSWLGVFFWRALSGVVTAGGIVSGVYFNNQIKSKQDDYNSNKNKAETISLHSDLKNLVNMRKLCCIGAAVGGTSFTLSIALPIIIKSGK